MSQNSDFDYICQELESRTDLSRLEARGTVRLCLKKAGLAADSTSAEEMAVVLDKLMSGELTARGVKGADALCAQLVAGLSELDSESGADSAREIFMRLGS